MINIFYGNGVKIPAYDDGTPVAPMSDWTQDIYDTIRTQFESGNFEVIPDPTPPPPEPDWTAFNMAMLADTDWGSWIGLSPLLLAATTSASLAHDLSQLQTCIDAAKASLPDPGATALTRWQGYADTYHIGLVF